MMKHKKHPIIFNKENKTFYHPIILSFIKKGVKGLKPLTPFFI
jgi:hypothetical protein